MEATTILAVNLVMVAVLMGLLWLVSLKTRDVSVVDLFWGLGFVLISWVTFFVTGSTSPRGGLVVTATTLWGLRLSGYLTWRNWGRPEDYRYATWRQQHGERFKLWSLVYVFGLQGLLMWFVSWPLQYALQSTAPLGWLDLSGLAVWGAGWLFESVGDWQLARFKACPANAGQVMDRGLWRYTRHPNYFGDFLVWWGFYLWAAAGGGWWTFLSPVVMSFLLMRVSGVPLLEQNLRHRRPGYEDYMRRTSDFFPRPPRRT